MNGINKDHFLIRIAQFFWPEIAVMPAGLRRWSSAIDVLGSLFAAPFAVAGLVWLVLASDWRQLPQVWPWLLMLLGLVHLLNRLNFFLIIEINGRYASSDGALDGIALWTGLLLVGPLAMWIALIWGSYDLARTWFKDNNLAIRWSRLRNFSMGVAAQSIGILVGLAVYRYLGGQYPIGGASLSYYLPALAAMCVYLVIFMVLNSGYLASVIWTQRVFFDDVNYWAVVRFFLTVLGLPMLPIPFSILSAGLFIEYGPVVSGFLMTGVVLISLLTHRLSRTAENNRQQSRQIEQLEQLGRAIITAPLDGSTLPDLLAQHVPAMFTTRRVAIWLKRGNYLLRYQWDDESQAADEWDWVCQQNKPAAFTEYMSLPWEDKRGWHHAVITAPILEQEHSGIIGGIVLYLLRTAQPWDPRGLEAIFPAVSTLGAQIASAIRRAELYAETLERQKMVQEMEFAGRIQASFLPESIPQLSGWQLSAMLQPARQTSGDYYDFIPLPNGDLGILVADVADKGLGAALYMALSRTLIRTYALEFPRQPALAIQAANHRLLQEARAQLFVTSFFAVLDPKTGTLTYCNAGHPPAYLFDDGRPGLPPFELKTTGMAVGIEDNISWRENTVKLSPGSLLVCYTDGIPEAESANGKSLENKKLVEIIQANLDQPVQLLEKTILDMVVQFIAPQPQPDDITLLLLRRDNRA
jgi:serine phosphatase RsbU (regulator of sigma subunit)